MCICWALKPLKINFHQYGMDSRDNSIQNLYVFKKYISKTLINTIVNIL
jgi:hypothetical protein